jgi:hypothetical protein
MDHSKLLRAAVAGPQPAAIPRRSASLTDEPLAAGTFAEWSAASTIRANWF